MHASLRPLVELGGLVRQRRPTTLRICWAGLCSRTWAPASAMGALGCACMNAADGRERRTASLP